MASEPYTKRELDLIHRHTQDIIDGFKTEVRESQNAIKEQVRDSTDKLNETIKEQNGRITKNEKRIWALVIILVILVALVFPSLIGAIRGLI